MVKSGKNTMSLDVEERCYGLFCWRSVGYGLLCWRSVVMVCYVGGVLLRFIMLEECC